MCEIKLLDAGYAINLQKYVKEEVDGHPLWTSRYLIDNPSTVVLVHRDFIKAGSQIVRTNTYQATVDGFIKYMGQSKESALDLIGKGVSLAKEAISLENKVGDVQVAGSVGPYGASLLDGSEYTGSYTNRISIEELICWHKDKVEQLVASGVDLLAFETIPCSKEAVALIRVLSHIPNIKAWLSFSIKDGEHISNGEKYTDAVEIVLKEAESLRCSDRLIAVGMNCLNPKFVSTLLAGARSRFPNHHFIVYPNTGENYNKELKRWEEVEGMKPVCDYIKEWLDLGARYVGGCCRTTDKDLLAIWNQVTQWKASC